MKIAPPWLFLWLRKAISHLLMTIESLRNDDDDDGNENGKKSNRFNLDKQNNNFARASRFFVHFSAVVLRIQRETA